MTGTAPLVSVVLTTHDRPHFLPIAFACFRHQTYSARELIVVDDSVPPIQESAVAAVGGRLVRTEPGTPLGVKLNTGFGLARGLLLHKMDDDDWYAPDFLARMVTKYVAHTETLCRPTILCMVSFPFFDLARWELRLHRSNERSGATLVFNRLDWEDSPFRPIPRALDNWFVQDLQDRGIYLHAVPALQSFVQLRHRGHLWTSQPDGTPMDSLISTLPLLSDSPESRLPEWAIRAYRELRTSIRSDQTLTP